RARGGEKMQKKLFCAFAAAVVCCAVATHAAVVLDTKAVDVTPITVMFGAPAAPGSVYDPTSDLTTLTTTTSVPHTYLGQGFSTNTSQGPTPLVTGMQMGEFILGAQNYADVHLRIQLWG